MKKRRLRELMAIGMKVEIKKGQKTKTESDKKESLDADSTNSIDSHKSIDAASADVITIDDDE